MMFRRHPIKLGILFLLLLAAGWFLLAITSLPGALKPDSNAPRAVLIENVRVISMMPGAPDAIPDQSVLVVDGQIVEVGDVAAVRTAADRLGTEVQLVKGDDRTLLPGLIDAHVHVWDEAELAGYLGYGVTSVRNMSGMPFHLPLSRRIEDGGLIGPDLLTTGPILNSPGANQQDNHVLVATDEEARAAVRKQADAGYEHLKVYSNLYPEPYAAILDEAEKLGLSVSGHTPEGHRTEGMPYEKPFEMSFEDILDDGFRTIEHTESIVWHGLRDQLDEAAMDALAEKIAAADVVVTPTLVAHANLIRVAESKGAYLNRPGTETINPVLKAFDAGTYEYWSQMDPAPREAPRAEFYKLATKKMADAGVPLIAGTDAGIFTNTPGETLHDEFDLLIDAGLTPRQVLESATVTSADALGLSWRGQVRKDYVANLILVDGDPLSDITLLRDLDGMMIHGVWFDRQGLAELREGATEVNRLRTARHLITMLMSQ
ncbi:amidohydrolase family protein [Parvularcula marina]|uniref:Amidohydrolase-related domain-containing protein n=1 Tax=Parvularcula marina TaxID=2292771 RepID=A0A371RKD7_9PROT|nr:amidohydrolase family protein [Parvularcula marina]RFB05913.1 hypothetical protein DX908_11925 [Parvularcula marina]